MRHLTRRAGACLLALLTTLGLTVVSLSFHSAPATGDDHLPWLDEDLPAAERAELLLAAMTLDEKLQQIYNEPVYNEDLDDAPQTIARDNPVSSPWEGFTELADRRTPP